MKRSLALSLVLCSTTLHAAPLVDTAGPDRKPGGSALTGAMLDQRNAGLAFGSNQYLAVWYDGYPGVPSSIKATRLAADGTVLDSPTLLVQAQTPNDLQLPAVTWDGTRYLVAWFDNTTKLLNGRWVGADGVLSTPFTLPTTAAPRVALASDTSTGQSVLVYAGLVGGSTALVARLVASGMTPGAEFTITNPASGNVTSPSVAFGPSGYVAAWEQVAGSNNSIQGAVISTSGTSTLIGQLSALNAASSRNRPSVAYGGGEYLIAWADSGPSLPRRIKAVPIASPLPALPIAAGTGQFDVEPSGAGLFSNRPQVAYIDNKFTVVWERTTVTSTSRLYGERVPPTNIPDGTVTALFGVIERSTVVTQLPDGGRATALASAGSSGRLVWSVTPTNGDGRGVTGYDVLTMPLPQGALVTNAVPTAAGSGEHTERSIEVASNGAGFMGVWEDGRDATTQGTNIYFQRFDGLGAPVGTATPVAAVVGEQRYPSVSALPGGDYLVAWMDNRKDADLSTSFLARYDFSVTDPNVEVHNRLYVARIGPDGTLRDPGGVRVPNAASASRDSFPRIVADPVHMRWLLTWDVGDDFSSNYGSAYAVIVRPSGAIGVPLLLDSGVSMGTARVCGANGAWAGSRFVIAAELGCYSYINPLTQALANNRDVIAFKVDYVNAADPNDVLVATPITISADTQRDELAPTIASVGDPADGSVLVAWKDHARVAAVPVETSTLRAARIAADGTAKQISLLPVIGGTDTTAIFDWPRLTGTGTGYLLTAIERPTGAPANIRAFRIGASGLPNGSDVSMSQPLGTTISTVGVADSLPPEHYFLGGARLPDPIPASVAVGSSGQVLVGYTAYSQPPVGESHTRLVGGRSSGEHCNRADNGIGCAEGKCTRDPAAADTVGVCCSISCGGACQRCSATGCDDTPPADPICGTVSCAALSTECRSFDTAPVRCLAFGECSRSDDLESCTLDVGKAINEGGACAAIGCTSVGACHSGDCVCGDAEQMLGSRSLLSCSYGGGGAPGAFAIAAVLWLLLWARRRRVAALLGLCLGAGCADGNVLAIDLAMDDETGRQAAIVRIVIDHQDQSLGFLPVAASNGGREDLTIRNVDIDGDGHAEIVADLLPAFPLRREKSYLAISPTGPEVAVIVRATALNRFGNPIATQVTSAKLPGDTLTLSLKCAVEGCAAMDDRPLTTPIVDGNDQGLSIGAVAAGSLSGQHLLASGTSRWERSEGAQKFPSAGLVSVFVLNAQGVPEGIAQLTGVASGDQVGGALAFGVVRGGLLDLVIGAPGANEGAGRIYVVRAPTSAVGTLSIGDASLDALVINGAPGDRLGSSLALTDVDGDGKLEIVSGAPGDGPGEGLGRVYVISDPSAPIAQARYIIGNQAGGHLGRTVATRGKLVAAGAPGANQIVAFDASAEPTSSGATAARVYTLAGGGAFGTSVAIADLDADGTLEVIAAAPSGSGQTLALAIPDSARAFTDADIVHVVRSSEAATQLGMALVTISSPEGDGLFLAGQSAASGLGYLLRGSAIVVSGPSLTVSPESSARSARVSLEQRRFTSVSPAEVPTSNGTDLWLGDDAGGLHLISLGLVH